MLMYGPARPKSPPHGKEGRNKVADRPTMIKNCTVRPSKSGWSARERWSAVDCLGPFCSCHNIIILLRLATHSPRHTAAADLIEARKVLALPKPLLSVLELCKVYRCIE